MPFFRVSRKKEKKQTNRKQNKAWTAILTQPFCCWRQKHKGKTKTKIKIKTKDKTKKEKQRTLKFSSLLWRRTTCPPDHEKANLILETKWKWFEKVSNFHYLWKRWTSKKLFLIYFILLVLLNSETPSSSSSWLGCTRPCWSPCSWA
jgi:hypothetical protein